jgi:hypothetical protein
MMRLAAALLLLTAPAMAQNKPAETVTVYGSTLVGLWRGGLVQYLAKDSFFSPLRWGPLHDAFCRIAPRQDGLEASCLQLGQTATVTADGNHVHFAWGTMMVRLVMDGEMMSAGHIRGHFQAKLLGITLENPALSESIRVTPDPAAPDKGSKAALLRRILEEGPSGVPHDDAGLAMKWNGHVTAAPKLGAVGAITYLGQETYWGTPPPPEGTKPDPAGLPDWPDFFSVYYVAFADGERLCGLHQRDDGVLDGFRCV